MILSTLAMPYRRSTRFFIGLLCVFAVTLLTTVGCGPGGPELGTVTGIVTFKGEPLPEAEIEFQPEAEGTPSYGTTDQEGRYELRFTPERNGAMVGTHRVQITTYRYESDDDGNEIAGIAMPDVTVPIATHGGWNPRHPDTGAPTQILDYVGSTVPFSGPKLAARYRDEDAYLSEVRAAAERLVAERYLLADDIDLCVRIARRRYRAITS